MLSHLSMMRGSTRVFLLAFAAAALLFAGCAKKVQVTSDTSSKEAAATSTATTVAPAHPATPEVVSPIGRETVSVEMPAGKSVYFDFDSSELSADAKSLLDAYGAWLNANIDVSVTVEGNCDQRGTREYNLALGQRRANVVRYYLSWLGISDKRMDAISFGEEQPVCPGTGEACWARNRRADIVTR
jgi:peptidoglycan-associated lipoprotein